MKLRLVMLGRTRRAEVRALLDDYVRRIGRYAEVEVSEVPDSPAALRKLKAEAAATWVLLDAGGRAFTSQEFARWLAGLRARGTRELVFLCGGAEGFPDDWRKRAQVKLSLSTMTFQHEFARVLLAEQLYRAFTILSNHPYSK